MEQDLDNDEASCHFFGVVFGAVNWLYGVGYELPVARERRERARHCNVSDCVASVRRYLRMSPEERVEFAEGDVLARDAFDLFVDMAIEESLKKRKARGERDLRLKRERYYGRLS